MTIVIDRFVSGGSIQVDRWINVVGVPVITEITGAQDGQPLTLTGTGFSASGNSVFAGIPGDDSQTPIEIPVDTEGTTEIVTEALDASVFSTQRSTSFFIRNSSDVASNAVSAVVATKATERSFLVTQEFLGDPSTRIAGDPEDGGDLVLGDEIRYRSITGAALGDPNFTGQAAFDVDDSVTDLEAAIFDGQQLGLWRTQTIINLVTTAVVPNVLGMTLEQAIAAIEAVNLIPSLVASVPSQDYEEGEIADQFPLATVELPLGTGVVELTLSLGDDVALVPDLTGLSQADAIAALTALGLAGSPYRVIDGNNTGLVITQSIAPETPVSLGTVINLAISSNLMPDLIGLLIQNAQAVIEAAGLVLNPQIGERTSAVYDPNEVISQDPLTNSLVSPGDTVTLVISIGAQEVTEGGTRNRPRKRYFVEVNHQRFEAQSPDHARALLERAKEIQTRPAPRPKPQPKPEVKAEPVPPSKPEPPKAQALPPEPQGPDLTLLLAQRLAQTRADESLLLLM